MICLGPCLLLKKKREKKRYFYSCFKHGQNWLLLADTLIQMAPCHCSGQGACLYTWSFHPEQGRHREEERRYWVCRCVIKIHRKKKKKKVKNIKKY